MGRLTQSIDFIQIVPLPDEIERSVRYPHISEDDIRPIRKAYKLAILHKKRNNAPRDRLTQIKINQRILKDNGIALKKECSVCQEIVFENKALNYVKLAYPDDVYLHSLL